MSRAKTPMIASGAALAGLAGGAALARNGSRSKVGLRRGRTVNLPHLRRPSFGNRESVSKALGTAAKALGNTAVEVGKAGYRVGELTTEVRRVREQASEGN